MLALLTRFGLHVIGLRNPLRRELDSFICERRIKVLVYVGQVSSFVLEVSQSVVMGGIDVGSAKVD